LNAAPMTRPSPIQYGEGLRKCLLIDLDGALGAGGVGQGGETYYPIHLCLRVPRTERVSSERIGVARSHEPRGWMLGRPEVTGLRFAADEPGRYPPRHLQELLLRQFRRENRRVAAAAVGLGPREVHERQGRRQGLYPVLGDIPGSRISTVGQGARFVEEVLPENTGPISGGVACSSICSPLSVDGLPYTLSVTATRRKRKGQFGRICTRL
jgi:hypothetical protein